VDNFRDIHQCGQAVDNSEVINNCEYPVDNSIGGEGVVSFGDFCWSLLSLQKSKIRKDPVHKKGKSKKSLNALKSR